MFGGGWLRRRLVSEEVGSEEVGSEEVGSEEVGSEEVGSEEVGSEEVGSEEVGSEEVGSEEVGQIGNRKAHSPTDQIRRRVGFDVLRFFSGWATCTSRLLVDRCGVVNSVENQLLML